MSRGNITVTPCAFNMSQVRNFGPSVVDGSKVTITVPKLLKKSDPESYLIYLLQVEVRKIEK